MQLFKFRFKGSQFLIGAVLKVHQPVPGGAYNANQFVELKVDGLGVTVLGRIRNTMRKVTIVVPVLITSCNVSE